MCLPIIKICKHRHKQRQHEEQTAHAKTIYGTEPQSRPGQSKDSRAYANSFDERQGLRGKLSGWDVLVEGLRVAHSPAEERNDVLGATGLQLICHRLQHLHLRNTTQPQVKEYQYQSTQLQCAIVEVQSPDWSAEQVAILYNNTAYSVSFTAGSFN